MTVMVEDFFNSNLVSADWEPDKSAIKVIGVGGGGCNAVTYMFNQGIEGCCFIVCNTDSQALLKSNVPLKIQLGEGLGAGTDPMKARKAAMESQDIIKEKVMDSNTKMLFITAGMGGGTGTGASPVIAKMAKDNGILTVAVVTLPFANEGKDFLSKAMEGIFELKKYVDSLLIINNEKLYEHFGEMLVHEALPKADDVLATAVRGIVDIISCPGYINVDFEDVKTVMKDSGMALMGCGSGTGRNRVEDAVKGAMESSLLNDFDPKTARNLLTNVTIARSNDGLKMNQLGEVKDYISKYTGAVEKQKTGIVYNDDPDFGDRINVTIIATGFKMDMSRFTGNEAGKFIFISKDFRYTSKVRASDDGEGISLPDTMPNIVRVGSNSGNNIPRFKFSDNEVPVLAQNSGQNKLDLESIPAIRRIPRVQLS